MGTLAYNQLEPTMADMTLMHRDALVQCIGETNFEKEQISPHATTCIKNAVEKFSNSMIKECASLPCYHQPISSLRQRLRTTYGLKINRLSLEFLNSLAHVEGIPPSYRETLQETIHMMKRKFLPEKFEKLLKKSAYRRYLPYLLEDFLAVHQLFNRGDQLKQVPLGHSKGFLYKIQHHDKTFGYLFGTMHELSTPELERAGQLSAAVYKKLRHCVLLGTEESCAPLCGCYPVCDEDKSVEKNLYLVARERGILNIGIDSLYRDNWDETKEALQRKTPTEITDYYDEFARAYQQGDTDAAHLLFQKLEEFFPYSPERIEFEEMRNTAMAQYIDRLLQASFQMDKAPSKLFFAVGSFHVLYNCPRLESVVSKLENLGWKLAYCSSLN